MFAGSADAAAAGTNGDRDGVGRRGDGRAGYVPGAALARSIELYRQLFRREEGAQGIVPVEFLLRRSALEMWTEARQRLGAAAGPECHAYVGDHQLLHQVALSFVLTHVRSWLEAVQREDPVAVRDRYTCQVPGCTRRAGSGHHLQFRSDGGPDELWNLLFLCEQHHLFGTHAGRMRIWGRAPDELVVQLGLRPDGSANETWVRRSGHMGASPGTSDSPIPRASREASVN